MNDKVNAIVLTSKQYRENDLLLTVLSEEYDVLTIILFNANKINSKRKSSSLPLTNVQFIIDYNETSTFYSPKSIDVIKQNHNLYLDSKLIICTKIIVELINKTNKNSDIYTGLQHIITCINTNNYLVYLIIFLKNILKIEGVIPEVNHCVYCNSTKIMNFSTKAGGLVCSKHNDTIDKIELTRIKKLRAIIHADYCHVNYFEDELAIDINDLDLLMNFYEYHLNIKIKSYTMLKSLDVL